MKWIANYLQNTNASDVADAGHLALVLQAARGVRRSTSGGLTPPHGPGAGAARSAHSALLAQYNETCEDWRSQCSYCGAVRVGSLRSLRTPCTCQQKETDHARQAQEVINGGASPLVRLWRWLCLKG